MLSDLRNSVHSFYSLRLQRNAAVVAAERQQRSCQPDGDDAGEEGEGALSQTMDGSCLPESLISTVAAHTLIIPLLNAVQERAAGDFLSTKGEGIRIVQG